MIHRNAISSLEVVSRLHQYILKRHEQLKQNKNKAEKLNADASKSFNLKRGPKGKIVQG